LANGVELIGGGINPLTHELDPDRMKEAVNAAVKTIVAGGGFIDDAAILALAKQAGGMGRIADPDKLFEEVITSIIDQGGMRLSFSTNRRPRLTTKICRFAWTTQTRCPHTHNRSSKKRLDT
jgi:hypothetical protein